MDLARLNIFLATTIYIIIFNKLLGFKIYLFFSDDLKEVILSKSKNVKHRISLRYSSNLVYGTCCLYKKQVEEIFRMYESSCS